MILGMSLQTFTILHVIISLVAIASGIVVVIGMFGSQSQPRWTLLFWITTVLTTVTGFLFPITKFTPALGTGVVATVIFVIALFALYIKHLVGAWRWIYVVTAVISLYLNVFVLIVQSFQKIPALQPLAPTQSEPPFVIAHAAALVLFVLLGIIAVVKFRPGAMLTPRY